MLLVRYGITVGTWYSTELICNIYMCHSFSVLNVIFFNHWCQLQTKSMIFVIMRERNSKKKYFNFVWHGVSVTSVSACPSRICSSS